MVAVTHSNKGFAEIVTGHWNDSIGNSIVVSKSGSNKSQFTAALTPLIDHPSACETVLIIRQEAEHLWRCGNANLEWADLQQHRLVWTTEDGRRSVWSRASTSVRPREHNGAAFPWLLNTACPVDWGLPDIPKDILHDGARIAALLDIRQMLGASNEPQERLTHILMDHDLLENRRDYLIPGPDSPLWHTLQVTDSQRVDIFHRINKIPLQALTQRIVWKSANEIHIGHHKITARTRDIQTLEARWALDPNDPRKSVEIARLLALYSVLDNPLSNKRNGVHLGLDPNLRSQSDYELFASPFNAAVANGHFASKWPHIEWKFGSIGNYPSAISLLPIDAVVCVNPPFTEAYLSHVMSRLAELKLRFRLRLSIPIQDMPWRQKLINSLPCAQLLTSYYDASAEHPTDVLHPTLLWEDPRCPPRREDQVSHQPVVDTAHLFKTHLTEPHAAANGDSNNFSGVGESTISKWTEFAAECAASRPSGATQVENGSNGGLANTSPSTPEPNSSKVNDPSADHHGGTLTNGTSETAKQMTPPTVVEKTGQKVPVNTAQAEVPLGDAANA